MWKKMKKNFFALPDHFTHFKKSPEFSALFFSTLKTSLTSATVLAPVGLEGTNSGLEGGVRDVWHTRSLLHQPGLVTDNIKFRGQTSEERERPTRDPLCTGLDIYRWLLVLVSVLAGSSRFSY